MQRKPLPFFLIPLVYAGLLAAMYYTTYAWLIQEDWPREDYNYCYLIPFVVLYLIWEKRKDVDAVPSRTSWSGLVLIVPGIVLFWLGELGGEIYSSYLSSWLIAVGLYWVHCGWQRVRVLAFPFFIALTMFPLPYFVNNKIMLNLKLISSQLGVFFLHLFGMSAYREGNIIDLGFTHLQVVDACSGLRYVIPLMILTLLLTYWFRASLWKRIVLFLSSIPISIISNSFRIALTGILYGMFGAVVAEGFFHGFSGWLIFMFVFPLILFEMWILRKLPPREEGRSRLSKKASEVQAEPGGGEKQSGGAEGPVFAALTRPVFLVPAGILLLTLALYSGVEFRQKVPVSKSFSLFPTQLGEWSGTRSSLEQEFINMLKFTDYTIVNFQNRQNQSVNFYVAYYRDQQKGGSIHSPETCLPGSGWIFRDSGSIEIPLSANKSIRVNRAFMERSGSRQLTFYWFPQRGRILTNIMQLKIFVFWDALTRQRTDGALVRIITPIYPNEKIDAAEARLQGFTKVIVPVLDEFIPGGEVR